MSKFASIKYPLFALRKKPYKISYDENKIYVQRSKDTHIETADDRRMTGDYFSRLIRLKKRLYFDLTCVDTQDVILSKPKWGVDTRGGIFDLTKKERFVCKVSRIIKVMGNKIYVSGVSYPFKIKTHEKLKLDDIMWAHIVYIDNVWYLNQFLQDWRDQERLAL